MIDPVDRIGKLKDARGAVVGYGTGEARDLADSLSLVLDGLHQTLGIAAGSSDLALRALAEDALRAVLGPQVRLVV
jgi:hypothetical protein